MAVIDHGHMIAAGTPDHLKARLSDTVHIRFAEAAALPEAVAALGNTTATTVLEHDQSTLELRAPNGAALLPEALRHLDGRGLTVTAAEVRRPALDDVFLALTGERASSGRDDRARAETSSRWTHHHRVGSHT